jgi:GNAT superfamily N-acetyltransferase
MTPETIRLRQKVAKRWAHFLGLYALDAEGRAVSQVQILQIDTARKDGREKVAGIAAAGTLPGYSRRGFSTALMKSAHERIRNEEIRLSLLTTSSSLVAHGMCSKLGYTTITTFQQGCRKGHHPPRRCRLKLVPFTQKDSKALDRAFAKQTSDALGFIYRQPGFLSIKSRFDGSMSGRDVAELYDANDKRFIMYSLEEF